MKTRILLAAATVVLLLLLALHVTGFIGSSSARIARDHSVSLPPSASHIQCEGPVCITAFGDFEADASFEMASNDFPALLSQFTFAPETDPKPLEPARQRRFVPARFGKAKAMYSGKSKDGNAFSMLTFDLGASRLGVCISTGWN